MEENTKEEVADNPFAFTKKQLGKSLYDPKNLNLLRAMMGVAGLAMGLRVDLNQGLSPDEGSLDGQVTLEDVWRRFETTEEDGSLGIGDRVNGNLIAHSESQVTRGAENMASEHPHPSSRRFFMRLLMRKPKPPSIIRNFTDRRLVFGENRIPVRPLRNIFQLVWIALHDKIIVPTLCFFD
jgi:P-type Ca2+ transporter type 2C